LTTYLYLSTLSAVRIRSSKRISTTPLPARGRLVPMQFDLEATLDHRSHHFRPHVVHRVRGRARKVPFRVAQLVPEVRILFASGVPRSFGAIDLVEGAVRRLVVADVVEDEELHLRAEMGDVRDPGRSHVVDRLASDVARVAGVVLVC